MIECSKSNQTGVGMVEVLVTVFVLAIGLLGIASLQFIGTFANSDALNRSQAVLITQQLAERLRANSNMSTVSNGLVVDDTYFEEEIYNFNNLSCLLEDTSEFDCFCLSIPDAIPNCNEDQCNGAEFAQFDGYEMSCASESSNPNMALELSCEDNDVLDDEACSAGSRHSIILKWPVQNWLNKERNTNADCNDGESSNFDCVVLDLTL
ncbi:type IV pilus modification protein PilV [Planctobacterium marinum]|nr:type IV pilus modification protein PilV [Planctobacterium marinum]